VIAQKMSMEAVGVAAAYYAHNSPRSTDILPRDIRQHLLLHKPTEAFPISPEILDALAIGVNPDDWTGSTGGFLQAISRLLDSIHGISMEERLEWR
jgi:hypothetical protein